MEKPLACSGRGSRSTRSNEHSVEPPKRELGGERRFRPCLPGFKGSKFLPEFRKRECALIPSPLPDRQALGALLVAVDDNERDLVELGVANPLADGLAGIVHLDPNPRERLGEAARRLAVLLPDRDHPHLTGGEPEREGPAVVLGQ